MLYLTPLLGFERADGWYRGEHVNQVAHGMGRIDGDDRYQIGEFKNGKGNGHHTTYRANGKIWEESNFIDGKLQGHVTQFNPDGSIKEESDWIHGVKQ